MKKILLLLALLIILPLTYFLLISKFNFGSGNKNTPITLNYWGVEQDESIIQPLIDKYQQAHPNIKIVYKRLPLNYYRETLQSRIASGNGPDIFRYHNTWVPILSSQLAPVPTNILDDNLVKSRYYPLVDRTLRVNGKLVGIPQDMDNLALLINTALFSQAGFTTPPNSWYDFENMAKKMTVRDAQGQIKVGGAALGTSNNVDYFSDILGMMFLQNGTTMVSGGQVAFSQSQSSDKSKSNLGADALSFYAMFNNVDHVWDNYLPSSIQAFEQGKAAMIFVPASRLPEIIASGRTTGLNFKVAPVPQLPDRPKVSWATFWVEGVSNKSKYQTEAWDFVNFLSEKTALEQRFNLASQTKALGLPFARMDMKSEQISNPYLGPYVDQAAYAQSWYLSANTFDNALNDGNIAFITTAVNSAVSNQNPVTALQAAAVGISSVLIKYNLAYPITPTP